VGSTSSFARSSQNDLDSCNGHGQRPFQWPAREQTSRTTAPGEAGGGRALQRLLLPPPPPPPRLGRPRRGDWRAGGWRRQRWRKEDSCFRVEPAGGRVAGGFWNRPPPEGNLFTRSMLLTRNRRSLAKRRNFCRFWRRARVGPSSDAGGNQVHANKHLGA